MPIIDSKPPNIVCYTDEQIEDMRNCMTNDSVIGIDRTFNLGPCFLTTLVYQNFNLIRKGSSTSPVMLEPVFIHWNGQFSTYCEFFSKIRSALGFRFPVEKIVFGTDEEQAMVNAVKTIFPNSEHILCTRHLKENAQRNMLNQKISEKNRSQVISAVFGPNGLLYSGSRMEFLEKEKEIFEQFNDLGLSI